MLAVYVFSGRLTPFQAVRHAASLAPLLTLVCDTVLFVYTFGGATSHPPNQLPLHLSLTAVVGGALLRMVLTLRNMPNALQQTPTLALGQLQAGELNYVSQPTPPFPLRPQAISEHPDSDRAVEHSMRPPMLPDLIQSNYENLELPADENATAAAGPTWANALGMPLFVAALAGAAVPLPPYYVGLADHLGHTYDTDGVLQKFEYASDMTSSRASESAEDFVPTSIKLLFRRNRRFKEV